MTTPIGSFVWYEYLTRDAEAAAKFYGDVVGWKTRDAGMVDFPYTLVAAGEDMVGGIMPMPESARAAGAGPFWLGYVGVPDVDAYAAKVIQAGGAIHRAPADIPRVGRFAVVADPHGAAFVLFQGEPPEDPRPPLGDDAIGNVGWRELRAGDLDSAFAFYSSLFGWRKTQAMDMGAIGTYQMFAIEGGQGGGMMTKSAETPAPYWLFYFNVEAIDAAAERIQNGGGQIVQGPHEVPGGGWVVRAHDPQGGTFALLASKR
ncbi:MAG: VOC family protein [Hyphomicrobiales bacterium]|nr:VOC family protein [Hyphomicrobiales bacterium]